MHNAAVALSCMVVWELGAADLACTCQRMALELVGSGVGHLLLPHQLGVARMAALLGETSEAAEYFSRTRDILRTQGPDAIRAIVDYDEALSQVRTGTPDPEQAAELLDSALAVFTRTGMEGWAERARALREKVASNHDERPAPHQPQNGVLTAREAEVVRLIALGKTNKEIASALVLSPATVERHITNIYTKIDARGRADATVYAFTHGLVEQPA